MLDKLRKLEAGTVAIGKNHNGGKRAMILLEFIFSSFWVWLGFTILVSMIGGGMIELVKACKRNRKVTAYRIGDRWHVTVENATKDEAQNAVISAAYAQNGEE